MWLRSHGEPSQMNVYRQTAGYSLVETLVAASLVATVLVPLIASAVFLTTTDHAHLRARAIMLAEEELERSLARFGTTATQRSTFDGRTFQAHTRVEPPFDIIRQTRHVDDLLTLSVTVVHGPSNDTLTTLQTARYRPN